MTKNRQRIVYICSLARSGSTYLQLELSCHPKVVGVGELLTVLKTLSQGDAKRRACLCGELGQECEFWGPILSEFNKLSVRELH